MRASVGEGELAVNLAMLPTRFRANELCTVLRWAGPTDCLNASMRRS